MSRAPDTSRRDIKFQMMFPLPRLTASTTSSSATEFAVGRKPSAN